MRVVCVLFALAVALLPCLAHAQEVRVGVLLAPLQRTPFEKTFDQFTAETGIKVRTMPRLDADYKRDMPIWLLEGKDTPDVVFWQASQRLFFYTEKDVVLPTTGLWNKEGFDQDFSHVKSAVSYKGEVYGLPVSYYHWGLYYRKSLIEKFGGPAATWEAFLDQCRQLKQAGIVPIGVGTRTQWSAAAWFDYLDLRINGLAFHRQLLAGKLAFTDPRVQRVLVEWKRLIDLNYFNADSASIGWDEVLPLVYRDRIAFTLIGNFVSTRLPEKLIDDIGFMPFPKISHPDAYEEAPMDILLIPRKVQNLKEAHLFLKFMARPDVQSAHNADLGYLPPNKRGRVGEQPFVQAGAALLRNAKDVSQYFDRDTLPDFEKRAIPVLAQFLVSGDVQETTRKLELARKDVFLK